MGGGGGALVVRQRQLRACAHRGMSEGDICAPSEAGNFVFLQPKSSYLVNTFRRKFRAGDG